MASSARPGVYAERKHRTPQRATGGEVYLLVANIHYGAAFDASPDDRGRAGLLLSRFFFNLELPSLSAYCLVPTAFCFLPSLVPRALLTLRFLGR